MTVVPARLREVSAPPNVVTLARLSLLPVALGLAWGGARGAAAATAAVSLAGDGLDGWVARRTGRLTELGKALDPVADKLTVDVILAFLVARGEFPAWALALVVARDAAIIVGACFLAGRVGAVPGAALPGKVALAVLGAMAVAFLWDAGPLERPLFACGMVVTVLSGAWYAHVLRRALRCRGGERVA